MKNTILLICILLLGISLRVYNLNFPSIGYHNMKENESLSIAQEMARTKNFIQKRVYFFNAFQKDAAVKDDPQPPLVSYQILLAWKMFGENLWSPRLFNVLFAILGIVVMYLAGCRLFQDKRLALFGAFLLSIMPLAVFFSRNLQPESPAFFFMLLGHLFYFRFLDTRKLTNLLVGGLAMVLAWAYKFEFIIGILPFAFCLPYKSLSDDRKGFLKFLFAALVPFAGILGIMACVRLSGLGTFLYTFKPFEVLTPSYWKAYGRTILWYAAGENFTFPLSLLATWGVFLAFFMHKSFLDRYLIGWAAAVVIHAMLFSSSLAHNSYAQMPFSAAVVFSCIHVISFMAREIKGLPKHQILIVLMISVGAFSIFPVYYSLSRMYATVFLGQDVAGETLKEFSAPDERIFLFSHAQGYAIARYAHRYAGWPKSLEEFKEKEKEYGIRFVCIYPGEYLEYLRKGHPDIFEYIESHYRIKEVGLQELPSRLGYLILERGPPAGIKIGDALKSVSGKVQPRSIYKILGKYIFYYALRPES
ncbi:MAG: glycosyltransferase family 39 protein [Candidatus Omnitrophota bacterium]